MIVSVPCSVLWKPSLGAMGDVYILGMEPYFPLYVFHQVCFSRWQNITALL